MRHRTISGTGLGNPDPVLMTNKGAVDKDMLSEAVSLFFSKWGGCDYQRKEHGILIGIEPSYQYEKLKVIFIAKDKKESYIENGVAWGSYGSNVVSTRRYYKDYKIKSKFIKFIDKWQNSKEE